MWSNAYLLHWYLQLKLVEVGGGLIKTLAAIRTGNKCISNVELHLVIAFIIP